MGNAVTIKDPVCGMNVNSEEAPTYEHIGQTYYFCSGHCRDKFAADPKAVLQPDDLGAAAVSYDATPADATYTCPMHPEIEQDHPGDCPKCGMALEAAAPPKRKTQFTCPMHPEIVRDAPGECPKCGMALEPVTASGDEEDPELKAMTRRFWTSVPLAVAVFVLDMGEMIPGLGMRDFFGPAFGWIQFILATPVVFYCGGFAFVRAWKSIVNISPNMWTLIALGVGTAYGFSTFALIAPDLLPAAFKSSAGHAPLYFEAASVIIALILLGQVMEARARGQTSRALISLMDLAPPRPGASTRQARMKRFPWTI